jgi:hypothetical protein
LDFEELECGLALGRRDLLGHVTWLAFEKTGHEQLVLVVLVRDGEDVGSLNRLREVSEDIVDDEKCGFGCGGLGDIYEHGEERRRNMGRDLEIASQEKLWEGNRGIQVFRLPNVSYVPFSSYPFEIIGGMLQQAALCPWIDSMCSVGKLYKIV